MKIIVKLLIFNYRYGREDEEVMGLKFCNEAVIALQQLWPKTINECTNLSPLQVMFEILMIVWVCVLLLGLNPLIFLIGSFGRTIR